MILLLVDQLFSWCPAEGSASTELDSNLNLTYEKTILEELTPVIGDQGWIRTIISAPIMEFINTVDLLAL